MWELDHQEGWVLKNWCFWIVLQKTLESPLDSKESRLVNPKGNQPWERTDAKVHLYLDHLTWRASSLEKTLMLGKAEGKRRRQWQRMRRLDGITNSTDMSLSKFQEIVKDRKSWLFCSPWSHELDTTDWLNNNSKPYTHTHTHTVISLNSQNSSIWQIGQEKKGKFIATK